MQEDASMLARFRRCLVIVAMLCAAVMAATSGARADLVYQEDFSGSDGGYTVANSGAIEGPWVYDGAETWTVDGSENAAAPTHSRLTSPTITFTSGGPVELSFVHRYSIEGGLWDGAAVFTSINGGPFEQVPGSSFTLNGYTGSGLIGNHDLGGGGGYNGNSGGYADGTYITSVAELGTLADGDTLALQFLGAWDEYTRGSSPNWQIDSLEVYTVAGLVWDNLGPGNWDSAHWTGGPPSVPTGMSYVLLDAANTDTVTVAADAVAAGRGGPNFDTPGTLRLTSPGNGETCSVFYDTPLDIGQFIVEFDYQLVNPGDPADGFVLVLQNDPRGVEARGGAGYGLGYADSAGYGGGVPIENSAAVVFNIYSGQNRGIDFTASGILDLGNNTPTDDVEPISGNVIHVTVEYDGTDFILELEDTDTGDTYTGGEPVDVVTLVGDSAAHVGFTGVTGGLNADQQISNFRFYYPLAPIEAETVNLLVTEDTTVVLNTTEDATFGNLVVEPGKLLTMEKAAAIFHDLTAGAGATVSADALIITGTLSSGGNPGLITLDSELEFDDTGVCRADPSADMLVVTADAFLAGSLELVAGGPMGDLAAGEWGTSTRTILSTAGSYAAAGGALAAVPEPGTLLALLSGALALLLWRRMRAA